MIFPKDKSADVTDVARKVAGGAAGTVPWVRVTNLARTIEFLKEAGVWLWYRRRQNPCLTGSDRTLRDRAGLEGSGMRRFAGSL